MLVRMIYTQTYNQQCYLQVRLSLDLRFIDPSVHATWLLGHLIDCSAPTKLNLCSHSRALSFLQTPPPPDTHSSLFWESFHFRNSILPVVQTGNFGAVLDPSRLITLPIKSVKKSSWILLESSYHPSRLVWAITPQLKTLQGGPPGT